MSRSKIISILVSVVIFLLCSLLPVYISAEEFFDNDFDYMLDVPEGYKVAEMTPDGLSYRFSHDRMAVSLVLRLYVDGTYSSTKDAVCATLDKFSAQYDIDLFEWEGRNAVISSMKMTIPGSSVKCSGWTIGVDLEKYNAYLVLICYADEDKAEDCQQFIVSTLNSLSIGKSGRYTPGIFTSYAFPRNKSETIQLKIAGKEIFTTIDKDDAAASEFVIDCEWAVLSLYAGNDLWKDAWVRYYKCIFRDSYSRVKQCAADIQSAFEATAKRKNPANPNITMNEILLNWVQHFYYSRNTVNKKSADLTSIPAILKGAASDCDGRGILVCALLGNMGTRSALFISREYKHALYGADLDVEGAKIYVDGTDFLLCETTAKGVKPGLVARDMNDTEKWIPVDFFPAHRF